MLSHIVVPLLEWHAHLLLPLGLADNFQLCPSHSYHPQFGHPVYTSCLTTGQSVLLNQFGNKSLKCT